MYMVAHFIAVSVSYRLKRRISGGWVGAEEDQDTCSLQVPSPQEYRAAGG